MRDISRSPCTTIFMQEAEMDKSKITITATEEQQKILNKRWDEAGIGNDYIFF